MGPPGTKVGVKMSDYIFVFVMFYIFLLLHEISHLIVYLYYRLSIYSFYFFPMQYKNKKIEVELTNVLAGVLGLVIPCLDMSVHENDKIKKIISKSVIAAPIMHFVVVIVCIFFFFFNQSIYLLYIIGINVFMFLSCLLENKQAYGDILAYYYLKKSPEIAEKIIFAIEQKSLY